MELDCHFIREKVTAGIVDPQYIQTKEHLVDLFMKGLSIGPLTHLLSKMSILDMYTPRYHLERSIRRILVSTECSQGITPHLCIVTRTFLLFFSFFSGLAKCLVPRHFILFCPVAVCYRFVISFLMFSSLFSINRALYGSFCNRMKFTFITLFLSISSAASSESKYSISLHCSWSERESCDIKYLQERGAVTTKTSANVVFLKMGFSWIVDSNSQLLSIHFSQENGGRTSNVKLSEAIIHGDYFD